MVTIMHNFLKTKMFYPLIWISNWVYQEVRDIGFRKILRAFYSCSHRLKIRPFAIVPMHCSYIIVMFCNTFLITSSIILHLNARLILTKLSGSTSVASDEGSSQQLLLSHSVITVSAILGSRENRIFRVLYGVQLFLNSLAQSLYTSERASFSPSLTYFFSGTTFMQVFCRRRSICHFLQAGFSFYR